MDDLRRERQGGRAAPAKFFEFSALDHPQHSIVDPAPKPDARGQSG